MTKIGRFDEPLETYTKDLRKVKTFAQFKDFEQKYYPFLDDAIPAFAAMDEKSFVDFRKELPKVFREGDPPSDEWMDKYGAIPLPKLFIELAGLLQATQMPSGFVMNRLLDERMAEIKEGRFRLIPGV